MYSLMLMDDVVKAVDRYAYLHNTNRSNLINQILAEYLDIRTPEMTNREIFGLISDLIDKEIFQVTHNTSDSMLSIRSSLQYKYRPTIKYNFELYRNFAESIGQLTVAFRTQSPQLLLELSHFFKYWLACEQQQSDCKMQYLADVGKFVRLISLPGEFDNKTISAALTNYILLFDSILKKYLNRAYNDFEQFANDYYSLRNYYDIRV